MYTFTADEYTAWEDNERSTYIEGLSKPSSTDGDLAESVDAGGFFVVFDNTTRGDADEGTDNEAEISVELIAGY